MSMKPIEAVCKLAEAAGNANRLSLLAGKQNNFFAKMIKSNKDVSCYSMAAAADAVGMKLCVCKRPPKDAIIIEPKED